MIKDVEHLNSGASLRVRNVQPEEEKAWGSHHYVSGSPALETLKGHLDMVMGSCSRWPCLFMGAGPDDLQRSLNHSVFLWLVTGSCPALLQQTPPPLEQGWHLAVMHFMGIPLASSSRLSMTLLELMQIVSSPNLVISANLMRVHCLKEITGWIPLVSACYLPLTEGLL